MSDAQLTDQQAQSHTVQFCQISLWLCLVLSAFFILSFITVASLSLTYPFQLEWMEGQVIDIIARITQGLPVYTRPTLEYVPFAYTPLYFYTAALLTWFTEVEFFPARLLSLASALGSGALIYHWVRADGGRSRPAFIAAGLFYSTYIISGRWFDVARIDSFFVMLSIMAVYVFCHHRNGRGAFFAGFLMACAIFTKQSACFIFAPVLLGMLALRPRYAVATGVSMTAFIIIMFGWANAASGGWFNFFVFELTAGHDIQRQFTLGFWTQDMIKQVAPMMIVAVMALTTALKHNKRSGILACSLAIGFISCSYVSRLNWGGFLNVLIPAYAGLALLSGLYLGQLERKGAHGRLLAVYVLLAAQMGWLIYDPRAYIPTETSRIEGEAFLQQISGVDGEVLLPEWQFVQTRIGKKSYTLGMASLDVLRTDLGIKNYIKDDLLKEIEDAIKSRKFAAIMPGGVVPMPNLAKYYRPAGEMTYPKEYIYGARKFLRTEIFVPRDDYDILRGRR